MVCSGLHAVNDRQTNRTKFYPMRLSVVDPSLTASLSVCLPQACLWLQTACRRTDACSHHTLEVVVVEVLTASAAIRFDRFNPRTRGKVSSSIPSVWKGKAKCGYTAMGRCWEVSIESLFSGHDGFLSPLISPAVTASSIVGRRWKCR